MSLSRRSFRNKPHLTVIQGEGRSPNPLRQASVYYLILVLAGALLFLAGYHWVGVPLFSRRLHQVTALPGHLDGTVETGGVITCREEVICAPCAGVLSEIAPPGERVLKDAVVARIFPYSRIEPEPEQPEQPREENIFEQLLSMLRLLIGREEEPSPPPLAGLIISGEAPPWFGKGEAITAPRPGMLSFYVDGCEGENPVSCFNDHDQFTAAAAEPFLPENGVYVEAGQPLLKIVDNWYWYYTVALPLDPGSNVAAREQVTLNFVFSPENPVEGFLAETTLDEASAKIYLTYRVERDLTGFTERRWADAVISYERFYGLLVPAEALDGEGEQTAVYLNQGGTARRCPVTVLALQDGQAVVEGFPPYSLVIARPDLVREGRRLDF